MWSVFSLSVNVRSERPHRGCAVAGRSAQQRMLLQDIDGGGHVTPVFIYLFYFKRKKSFIFILPQKGCNGEDFR